MRHFPLMLAALIIGSQSLRPAAKSRIAGALPRWRMDETWVPLTPCALAIRDAAGKVTALAARYRNLRRGNFIYSLGASGVDRLPLQNRRRADTARACALLDLPDL
jgi:hypothetical protein